MDFESVIFCVDGGIGKNIMATVPLRAIKKKYPDKKIIVVCGYTEVFAHNPNVHRVYHFSQAQYVYDDYINNGKSIILRKEPYIEYDYLYKNKHLTQVWCELMDLEWDNSKPDLFFTDSEVEGAREFLKSKKRPVLLTHLTGGAIAPLGNPTPKMYVRSLPMDIANEVVTKLRDDYHIISIAGQNQPIPDYTERATYMLRQVMALAFYADKSLYIDSFMQHTAAAIDKKAVVLWGGTSPKVLGYDLHTNLTQEKCPTPYCHRPNSYLFDMMPYGVPWDCKHSEICMKYDVDKIVNVVKELEEKKAAAEAVKE